MDIKLVSNDSMNVPILMANLLLDIATEKDTGTQGSEVNLLLTEQVKAAPETAERLLMDLFHQLFRAVGSGKGTPEEKWGQLEEQYKVIFKGLDFTSFADLRTIWDSFNLWWTSSSSRCEESDKLYALSKRLTQPLLRYAIQRRVLDLLMNSSAFLKRIALCRSLIADLEATDTATREAAACIGADYYFYEGWETV